MFMVDLLLSQILGKIPFEDFPLKVLIARPKKVSSVHIIGINSLGIKKIK
jgi:hypothetical protein